MYRTIFILFWCLFYSGGSLYSQGDFYDPGNIHELRLTFTVKSWKHDLDSMFQANDQNGRLVGDIAIDGHLYKGVGVRYKGFSSWNLDVIKNPFNIELDYTIKNQNCQGFTKLKLSNVIHDPSFIREVLSYEIARKYMPASRAGFANLYINDTLIGLYSNIEAVDKAFISNHFSSKNNSFFKGDPITLVYPFGANANLDYSHGSDSLSYVPYYKIESDYGWSDLLKLIYTVSKKVDSIENVLNTDRTLWMHAFNYSLVNLDSYIAYAQNYYVYEDDNGRFNPIIWDLNMSFGSFRHSDASTNFQGLSIAEAKVLDPLQHLSFSISPRPLMTNLFKNDRYRKIYLAHIRTILKENFANNTYYTRGHEIQNLIASYVEQDTNKFYSDTDFTQNIDTTVGGVGTMILYPGIKELMVARVEYLQTYPGYQGAPQISTINHTPSHPELNQLTWITAKVEDADTILLAYRIKNNSVFTKVQMYDDGQHHDGMAGDKVYGVSLVSLGHIIQYYIYAENDSAALFSPERAEYEFYTIHPALSKGDFVINEFMSTNLNTVKDQDGEYDSWIELQNNTDEELSLKNIYLSDDAAFIDKWTFPDTLVAARKRLVIWADNDNLQKGLHANFTLPASGGSIFLTNSNYQIIDSIDYSQQIASKSFGRYPNGYGSFDLMNPTFSRVNQIGDTWDKNCFVYPNPANNILYIEVRSSNTPTTFNIYNTGGQLIRTGCFSYNDTEPSTSIHIIDVSGIRRGIYFVKIEGTEVNYVTKIFIY